MNIRAQTKQAFNEGFNAGLREAASVAGANLRVETFQSPWPGVKPRKGWWIAIGSKPHADAIMELISEDHHAD